MLEAYPNYVKTDIEKIYWSKIRRQEKVIRAMQGKFSRDPISGFLWRKPWKAPSTRLIWNRAFIYNFWQWLSKAHDCSDPAIGCSCTGGFLYPVKYDKE